MKRGLNHIVNDKFEYFTNEERHQGDSKLCGMFITDFFTKMIYEDEKRRELFVKISNKNLNYDKHIQNESRKYVTEYKNGESILKNNLNCFLQYQEI